jgi:hypothetical protein
MGQKQSKENKIEGKATYSWYGDQTTSKRFHIHTKPIENIVKWN